MNKDKLIEKFNAFLSNVIPVETPKVIPEVELADETKVIEDKPLEVKAKALEDGTIVEYDVLEVENKIDVVAEDGTLSPLKTGDYVIEGKNVKVEDGLIKEVTEITAEDEPEVVPEVEAEEIQEIIVWTMNVTNTSFKEGDVLKYLDYDDVEQAAGSGEFQLSDGRRVVTDATGTIVLIKPAEVVKEIPLEDSEAKLAKEVELKLSKEISAKQVEMQATFDKQLAEERLNFKSQLEELANDVKLSNIVQAPVEDKTPKAPLTAKDRMVLQIEKQRKNK